MEAADLAVADHHQDLVQVVLVQLVQDQVVLDREARAIERHEVVVAISGGQITITTQELLSFLMETEAITNLTEICVPMDVL